jgi:hypothetical protein
MLINNYIRIIVNGKHIQHLKSLGYEDIKCYKELEILTEHLPQNSNIKVNVMCDNCFIEKSIKYQDYNKHTLNRSKKYHCLNCSNIKIKETMLNRYGGHYAKTDEYKEKMSKTSLDKYGHTHYSKTSEYKEKFKKTCSDRYGVDNPFKSDNLNIQVNKRISMEENNKWIRIDKMSEFNIYKNKVRKLTRNNVKLLKWDGFDFYDNEYIEENFTLNPYHNNYPTIDHKISIYDGFTKNIPADDIAGVNNLCWTKRIINITKNKKSHY